MRVAFRVDGSASIGMGHLYRCNALAEALRALGAQVLFVSRAHDALHAPTQPAVGPCAWLPVPDGLKVLGPPRHAGWAGVPWEQDAKDTTQVLAHFSPDWLIVDHYAFDARWHRRMHDLGYRIAAIDDLADRPLAVQLLLDQNLHPDHRTKYGALIPSSSRLLGGPHYALLSAGYAAAERYVFNCEVRSIGIFMGGGDPQDFASLALSACRELAGFRGKIELVSASASPHHAARVALARRWPGTEVLADLPDLCGFFARHDLQIGGGGGAAWERCCMGAPTVAFSIADNQEVVLPELEARGALLRLPGGEDLPTRLGAAVAALMFQPQRRRDLSQAARVLVDGWGATRAAAVLSVAIDRKLALRPAAARDESQLLAWANDPVVRRQSFDQDLIDPATHASWFAHRLAHSDSCLIFVAEVGQGVPAGQVRLERGDNAWEIDYSLDPAFRGWGLAAPMLAQALSRAERPIQFSARVKVSNSTSAHVFRKLGFVEGPRENLPEPCHTFTLLQQAIDHE
jgi:UDP-2,4-diacetamido-2,4,6-trideoxy-beta-L-altropyranose hydrolase